MFNFSFIPSQWQQKVGKSTTLTSLQVGTPPMNRGRRAHSAIQTGTKAKIASRIFPPGGFFNLENVSPLVCGFDFAWHKIFIPDLSYRKNAALMP